MTDTPTPKHVFMSYSRRDEAAMRRVVAFLRKQGINVWVDNEKLVPGTPIWEEAIEKAIHSASAVVVILSPDSKKSVWVRREISFAERYQKRIFPIMVAGDEGSSITLRLTTSQYVDIRKNEEVGLNSLKVALLFYLEELEARKQAERKAAEKAAREEDERGVAEKAEKEKVEREAVETAAREKKEREAAKKAPNVQVHQQSAKQYAPTIQLSKLISRKWVAYSVIGLIGIVVGVLAISSLSNPSTSTTASTPTATHSDLNFELVSTPVTGESTPNNNMGKTSSNLLEDIKNRGYILISTDPNYEPQSFLNTSGKRGDGTKCPIDALTTAEIQGFDVDVAIAIGNALGVETCFATPNWDVITAGNWADKWDVSVGSMYITTDRQKILDFSTPYYYIPAVVAVTTNSAYASLDDLAGKAICAGASTNYEVWLAQGDMGLPASSIYAQPPADIRVVPLDTDQECAQALAAGREDFAGYVTSQIVVNANIAAGLPVKQVGGAVFSENLAAAFDKSSTLPTTSLRAEVDKIISGMHSDGTLTALSKKWFEEDITQSPK